MGILDEQRQKYGVGETTLPQAPFNDVNRGRPKTRGLSILDSQRAKFGLKQPEFKEAISEYSLPEANLDPSMSVLDSQRAKFGLSAPKAEEEVASPKQPAYTAGGSMEYPEHLLQAELSGRREIGTKLHGNGTTIGYGLDLKYDKSNYGFLRKAGVDSATIARLKRGDKTATITPEQAREASNLAYRVKYKQIKSLVDRRFGTKFDSMSGRMQDMMVSLGYNGYLTNVKRKGRSKKALNEFRGKIWQLAKANDEEGLLEFIKNSSYGRGAVRNRFRRSGFI